MPSTAGQGETAGTAGPDTVNRTIRVMPEGKLSDADLAGLPMPENVWDDEKRWD